MRAPLKSLALLVLLLCFVVTGEMANAAGEKIKVLIVTNSDRARPGRRIAADNFENFDRMHRIKTPLLEEGTKAPPHLAN